VFSYRFSSNYTEVLQCIIFLFTPITFPACLVILFFALKLSDVLYIFVLMSHGESEYKEMISVIRVIDRKSHQKDYIQFTGIKLERR
jgi:hypothetical protein